ncbi:Serine/threonine kinase [Gonapodya sp. JEL0774]|nr:Serine/threonine kinase [Gonapodya sp. JEL0774]
MEDQIQKVQEKLYKERRMLEAAHQMLRNAGSREGAIAIAQSIKSSQQNVDYLQTELERLTSARGDSAVSLPPPRALSPGGNGSVPVRQQADDDSIDTKRLLADLKLPEPMFPIRGVVPTPVSNHFQYWRTETPLTKEKIAFKIRTVQQKNKVEARFREGAEKLLGALVRQQQQTATTPSSKADGELEARLSEIRDKLIDSAAKTPALTAAMTKWNGTWTGSQLPEAGEHENSKSPVGGHLSCTVLAAINLPNRKQGTDLYAVVRVDQNECGRTRPERLGVWRDEVLRTSVERAFEVEVSIFDQATTHAPHHSPFANQSAPTVQGMVWFNLSDLVNELSSTRAGKSGILVWLELEPAGQILLKLNFGM